MPITASAKGRGRAGNPKVVIRVRPRQADATVNLRPYEELKLDGAPLALNAARRALAISAEDGEGVSPFLRETFEPILRACQSQIDAEGRYLPDSDAVDPSDGIPPASAQLTFSDRWVTRQIFKVGGNFEQSVAGAAG